MLLEEGAKVNRTIDGGWTALHLAARYGHSKTVQVTLEVHEQFSVIAFLDRCLSSMEQTSTLSSPTRGRHCIRPPGTDTRVS